MADGSFSKHVSNHVFSAYVNQFDVVVLKKLKIPKNFLLMNLLLPLKFSASSEDSVIDDLLS